MRTRLKSAMVRSPIRRLDAHGAHLRVRQGVELLGQPERVDGFQGGGVDGVAAEVAIEVAMRLEQRHRARRPARADTPA